MQMTVLLISQVRKSPSLIKFPAIFPGSILPPRVNVHINIILSVLHIRAFTNFTCKLMKQIAAYKYKHRLKLKTHIVNFSTISHNYIPFAEYRIFGPGQLSTNTGICQVLQHVKIFPAIIL